MIKTFLHSVIGDNTKENREHLEKIGAKLAEGMSIDYKYLYVYVAFSGEYCYYSHNDRQPPRHVINCIGNPQLFQAVSAMRNDSDYLQWFTNDKCDEWLLCKKENYQDFVKLNVHVNFYKATLSELEAHFQRV